MKKTKKVFLSHINEEAKLALALKDHVTKAFEEKCEVFVSSDFRDVVAGDQWRQKIEEALKSSDAFPMAVK